MAKNLPTGTSGRKPQWFARRQVYLRTGQDSQYVELSPMLQIGVALGFGALALWLIGASYGAVTGVLGESKETALLARLGNIEQSLEDAERTRDAALADAARAADLEAELIEARATVVEPAENDDTLALTTELEQTREQLDDLHARLSESKADQAALQARLEAEALATNDAGAKTAEEAASLHAQLEDAFDEMENLQKERDELTAKLVAMEEENIVKGETTERNTALLKAATAEIERLQGTISATESEAVDDARQHEEAIARLEAERDDAFEARNELEREIASLTAELEAVKLAEAEIEQAATPVSTEDASVAIDAAVQARSIAAGLTEADLLAEIEDLRYELAASKAENDAADDPVEENEDLAALRQRVTVAETELERLLLAKLKVKDEPGSAPQPAAVDDDPAEAERLRAELLTAQADIIKLKADVKAAKLRLAEKTESETGQASRPDNSAKLEQQLASTRSRVQQLNKALADAKLREVAIDLALINVVPTPSPPAPR